MIRSSLAALWTLARAHRHFLANFLLPLSLALLTCVSAGAWDREHTLRARNERTHAADLRIAAMKVATWTRLYGELGDSLARRDGVVTVTREHYTTLRDTVWGEVERAHSQVVDLLPHLPMLLRASDSAVAACTEYQLSCTAYRHVTDSLVAALRVQLALAARTAILKPPRWTAEAEALYDGAAIASAGGALRVVGSIALVGRVEQRVVLGEPPRVVVGVRITR